MELNKYQQQAMTTCMESSNNFAYMFYNLLGEVGELIEKVLHYHHDSELANVATHLEQYSTIAKAIRKEHTSKLARIFSEINSPIMGFQTDTDLHKELGDILWQLSGLCQVLGLSLDDIAQQNIDKLASRQQRNVIDGSGDNR